MLMNNAANDVTFQFKKSSARVCSRRTSARSNVVGDPVQTRSFAPNRPPIRALVLRIQPLGRVGVKHRPSGASHPRADVLHLPSPSV